MNLPWYPQLDIYFMSTLLPPMSVEMYIRRDNNIRVYLMKSAGKINVTLLHDG